MPTMKSFLIRIWPLIWMPRPWITVCSNCHWWRPKESTDEAGWMYPYKDYPPRTPNVSHGLCKACHTLLYCKNLMDESKAKLISREGA